MGSEHSHAVAGVVDARSDVVEILCFRLSLIFFLYSVGLRKAILPRRGEVNRTTSRMGTCSLGLLLVAVQFRALHAQDTASAHNDV